MSTLKDSKTMQQEQPIGTARSEEQGRNESKFRLANYRLAQLVPAVMVAWADGEVDERERQEILRIAALRGVREGSEAHARLQDWMEEKPSMELYEAATRSINQMLRFRPRYEAASLAQDLKQRTTEIAMVSRSYWGLGPRVTSDEQALVEKFEQEIRPFTFPLEQS